MTDCTTLEPVLPAWGLAETRPARVDMLDCLSTLYYGDNLTVLRNEIPDESVDLVYLDPPFNSQASYNVLFRSTSGEKSQAQIEAFGDTWHWGEEAERAFDEVMGSGNASAAEMLRAMRAFLKENDMMAYLCMMAIRLLELHRVLKTTGSLYLHCDPTASHYLKLLMDALFGNQSFRNEIVWKRTSGRKGVSQYGRVHDIILFYTKSGKSIWNPQALEITEKNVRGHDIMRDEKGRPYRVSDFSGAGQGPPRRFGDIEFRLPRADIGCLIRRGLTDSSKKATLSFHKGVSPASRPIWMSFQVWLSTTCGRILNRSMLLLKSG